MERTCFAYYCHFLWQCVVWCQQTAPLMHERWKGTWDLTSAAGKFFAMPMYAFKQCGCPEKNEALYFLVEILTFLKPCFVLPSFIVGLLWFCSHYHSSIHPAKSNSGLLFCCCFHRSATFCKAPFDFFFLLCRKFIEKERSHAEKLIE